MLTPIVCVYRFDEKCGTYESFTVITMMQGEATCHGLDRTIKPSQARRLLRDLRLNGIHTLRYVRHGRAKEVRL